MKRKVYKIIFDVFFLTCIFAYVLFFAKEAIQYYSSAEGIERAPGLFLPLLTAFYGPFLISELFTYITLRNTLFNPIRTKKRMVLRFVLLLICLLCLIQSAMWIPSATN